MPRPRPPFPAQSGLWGKPTNINNVETYANVPLIILNGADQYASVGTEQSKGTKIFSLAGKINNTGLVEVPIGIPIRKVIFEVGGGVPRERKFKAVQMGGPSGGCVPEEHLDLPVDYGSLEAIGAIMGSGGMVVMDEDTCMVDTARYFLAFTQVESCGKCVPCRLGTKRMLEILTRITEGQGTEGDIELLIELAEGVRDSALCGLGQTCPNPVLTTVRYFRNEYEEHVLNHRCPARVCKALISYYIDPEKCQACLICLRQCPAEAIEGSKNTIHVINQEKCTKCGICLSVCPPRFSAVRVLSGEPIPPPLPATERGVTRATGEER
jgi:NADH-quinone oxidoreductase subunit F